MDILLPTTPDATNLISQLLDAMRSGEWTLVVASAIWLFVFLVKLFWSRWSSVEGIKPLLPWLAVIVGVLAAVASGLASSAAWTEIVALAVSAAGAGLAAVGLDKALIEKLARLVSPAKREEKRVKAVVAEAHRTGSLNLADLGGQIKIYGVMPGEER